MPRVIQSSRRKAPGNVGWSFIAEPRKHPECRVFFTSAHMFFVMGGCDDLGLAHLGPRQPAGARPARDYPTVPRKDVWNCDGHENKMTKFARQCVEERVSCWHAQRCVRRYVCVCVCPVSGQAGVSQWVFSRSELWSRLIAGALSGKLDQLNTLQLYALIDYSEVYNSKASGMQPQPTTRYQNFTPKMFGITLTCKWWKMKVK